MILPFHTPINRLSAFRIIVWIALFFSVAQRNNALAQTVQAASSCSFSGADTVTSGSTATYTLGPCTATNWTASCGTISSQAASIATLNFAGATCASVTITATKGGVTLATKKVIVVQMAVLSAGNISNTPQIVNYHGMPQPLTAPPASGGSCGGVYSYQWLSSIDSINYSPIAGAVAQNYQPGPLTATTYFKRQASCGGSTLFTTNAVKVIVYPATTGVILRPAAQSVNYHTVPAAISMSALPASNGNFSYQWQSSASPSFGNVVVIGNGSSTSFTPDSLSATTYYRLALIRNGDSLYSVAAVVNVFPPLVGASVSPASQTVALDSVPALMTVGGITGGNGAYTYQWYSSTDGSSWSLIEGVTSSGYIPAGVDVTTYYRVLVTSNGSSAASSAAVVKVN